MTAPQLDHGGIERVAWPDFLAGFDWRQGEHVSLIGPTGQGKTTLALQLLPRRGHVLALGTKPKDPTLSKLQRSPYVGTDGFPRKGWRRIEKWPPSHADQKVLLWPKVNRLGDTRPRQQKAFGEALEAVYEEHNWCVYVDELRYICRDLRLADIMQVLWLQGRSVGLSIVGGTQRPAWVPVEVYDQATHLFFFHDNDERNLKTIGGVGWLSSKEIRQTVAALPRYNVLYVNTRTGQMLVTKAEGSQ